MYIIIAGGGVVGRNLINNFNTAFNILKTLIKQ